MRQILAGEQKHPVRSKKPSTLVKKKKKKKKKNGNAGYGRGARINFTFPQCARLQRYARKCLPLKKHSSIRNVTWCRYPLLVITSRVDACSLHAYKLTTFEERENVSSARERSGYIFLRGRHVPNDKSRVRANRPTDRNYFTLFTRTEFLSFSSESRRMKKKDLFWRLNKSLKPNCNLKNRNLLNKEDVTNCDCCKVQSTVQRIIVQCRKYIVNTQVLPWQWVAI